MSYSNPSPKPNLNPNPNPNPNPDLNPNPNPNPNQVALLEAEGIAHKVVPLGGEWFLLGKQGSAMRLEPYPYPYP